MASREQAAIFARIEEILIGEEYQRADQFLELMVECAEYVADDPDAPTPLEWLTARALAAGVWRFDRETSDGEAMRSQVLSEPSYNASRRNAWAEADTRCRLQKVYLDAARNAKAFYELLKSGARGQAEGKGKVVPMRKRER